MIVCVPASRVLINSHGCPHLQLSPYPVIDLGSNEVIVPHQSNGHPNAIGRNLVELRVWGAEHPVSAKGCLQCNTTSLQGHWELISTAWTLAPGEKTADVVHRLFFWVTLGMLADVIGDVSLCGKCT